MAKFILSDQRTRKRTNPETLYIPDIPTPEKNPTVYFDAHPKAPTGLALKVTPAGSKKWILCYYVNSKERRTTLDKGSPAWGPQRARKEATDLKTLVISGADLLAEKAAKKAEKAKAAAKHEAKKDLTLGNLLLAYVQQLEQQGKYEARAIKNSLIRNVQQAHADLWNTLADELTMPDFRDIIGTLVTAEKYREAQKVRAYLRAAYAAAIRAHRDPAAVPELRQFNIQTNPARDVAPVTKPKGNGKSKPRKPLTLSELRAYWKRISALPSPDGPVLQLHLLTGGQRLRQLCRLQADDVDGDQITLRDPKGRRAEEREHVVPLVPAAQTALEAIGAAPWLVSFGGGKTPADAWLVSKRIKDVAAAMLEAEETSEVFTGKIIRSTVETRLTQAGVSPHVLAHLLSHGLGTLQEVHYQFYDFGPEKRAALETLHGLLKPQREKVVPMKRRAKK